MHLGSPGSEPRWARRLIRIAEEFTCRPSPPVQWRWVPAGHCDWECGFISMPSVEWRQYHHCDCEVCQSNADLFHQAMLLHELAHWYEPGGHTKEMYALFFWLVKQARLPIRLILRDEMEYKPRAARSGYRLYRKQIRERGASSHHIQQLAA